MPYFISPVVLASHPAKVGPIKPPKLPKPLMKPRAAPERPAVKSTAGIAQKGLCIALVNKPVITSKKKENQICPGKRVAKVKKTANPPIETAVFKRRFPDLSDKAPNIYKPPRAMINGSALNQPTFVKLIFVRFFNMVGNQMV